MMHPLFSVVGVKVARDGSVRWGDNWYWSEASAALAGQWVSMTRPRRGEAFVMLAPQSGDDVRADLFRTAERARPTTIEEQALIIRRKAEALAQLIDQRLEHHRLERSIVRRGLVRNVLNFLLNKIPGTRKPALDDAQHGNLEQLQRLQIEASLAEAIFGNPQTVVGVHFQGDFSFSDVNEAKRIATALSAHRLSGGAK